MLDGVRIRVLWEPLFLIGRRIVLFFDGVEQPTTRLHAGIDLSVETTTGRHTLDVRIPFLLGIARSRRYVVEIPAEGEYLMRLHYSRAWGNFDKKAAVSRSTDS